MIVQRGEATHQAASDSGSWEVALTLLFREDSLARDLFGNDAVRKTLEGYQFTIWDLRALLAGAAAVVKKWRVPEPNVKGEGKRRKGRKKR